MLKSSEFAESFHICVQQAEALGLKGEELSAKAFELLQFYCGGLILYVPKIERENLANRNKAIISEFNGNNHARLARKYGISIQLVYRILRDKKKYETY